MRYVREHGCLLKEGLISSACAIR